MLHKEIPAHFPGFLFIEKERLSGFVSDGRFREMVFHEHTYIYEVSLAAPSYGEFIFLTASLPTWQGRVVKGFYGLGFHRYGQEWLVDRWRFYTPKKRTVVGERHLPKEGAAALLRLRKQAIRPLVAGTPVWSLFRLPEILADLQEVGMSSLQRN